MNATVDLQIACTEKKLPSLKQFQLWVDAALAMAYKRSSDKANDHRQDELSIRLVDIEESQSLNHQFRHKDKPTNVLSFPFELPPGVELNLLGDLVICADIVKNEAKNQQKQDFHHWAHMVIHGCLHLLGFDHINDSDATQMESLEIEILATLDIDNPYISHI